MRVAVFLNTPAQVHLYRNVIAGLKERNHDTIVLARNYGDTIPLLKELGLSYLEYLNVPRSKPGKLASFPTGVLNARTLLRDRAPEVIVDAGVYGAATAALLGSHCIIFSDSEPTPVQFLLMMPFADTILTPDCFGRDLGRKHRRVRSYKELAYLHPNRYTPDPSIWALLGIDANERFAVARFNGFDAVHDFGAAGFRTKEKRQLVEELSRHCRVYISSEEDLPPDLAEYSLTTPKSKIHDVLYYASLLVTDTQTMATEAAVLGTPVVRCNSFVGAHDMGNFVELEREYGLVFNYDDPQKAIAQAVNLVTQPNLKSVWREKRDRMLKDKVDLTQYIVDFIDAYSDSRIP